MLQIPVASLGCDALYATRVSKQHQTQTRYQSQYNMAKVSSAGAGGNEYNDDLFDYDIENIELDFNIQNLYQTRYRPQRNPKVRRRKMSWDWKTRWRSKGGALQ